MPGACAGGDPWVLVPAEAGLVAEGVTSSVQRSPLDELLPPASLEPSAKVSGSFEWLLVL